MEPQKTNDFPLAADSLQKTKGYPIKDSCLYKKIFGDLSKNVVEPQKLLRVASYYLERLIKVIDTLPLPIIIHNTEFKITQANTAYQELVQQDCQSILGHYYGEFFPLDDGNPPKCVCKLDPIVKFRDRFFRIYSYPMEDPTKGCYQLSLHIFEDVTSQQIAIKECASSKKELEEALIQTISVVAQTAEAHDPFTAGHQKRVAMLATAIAKEMHLSPYTIKGLELGALIHDIGKIQIPYSILSKPGTLRKEEYYLLKLHPKIGYQVTKDLKLPWPIAKMIYQHHERLDGSGYPNGLKGEGICLEARIIAIADVVEAMTAYRPYHLAKSIEDAIDEISKNAGTLYDAKVAQVCVDLLKNKKFIFPAR